MTLPSLPEEIWKVILQQLYRSPPKPGKETGWYVLHQQDLFSAIQVNSTFFQICSNVLYEKPIVANITSFFYPFATLDRKQLPEYEQTRDWIFQGKTKEISFSHVKHLNVIHRDVDPKREITYEILLWNWVRMWEHIGQVDSEARYRGVSPFLELQWISETFKSFKQSKPFPNLISTTLGLWGSKKWLYLEAQLMKERMDDMWNKTLVEHGELQDQLKIRIGKIMGSWDRKYHCDHLLTGPFGLPSSKLASLDGKNLEVIFSHCPVDRFYPPGIVVGCRNVVIIPRFPNKQTQSDFDQDVSRLQMGLFGALATKDAYISGDMKQKTRSEAIKNTTIEIYGMLETDGPRRHTTVDIMKADRRRYRITNASLDGKIPAEWKGKVVLKPRCEAPVCPGCGLGPMDL